ncbi:hypothetical protein B0H17DRAFT_1172027 [Mycena rosella]|uniref:Uncharacterized protein n=1 Tax=Mycena rosella TaxID=1033263 RepID=A0AAD7CR49_MYCRO|nr:hypothetical protein B0H17DRAFT_1172027 [Mycena rosella]
MSPPGDRASPVAGGGDAGGGNDPPFPPLLRRRTEYHPLLNGRPCDRAGNFLLPATPPPPREHPPPDDYSPYDDHLDFQLADLLYRRVQMSAGAIDELMQNWAARPESAGDPPFADHEDLYSTIDATEIGHVPWQSFEVTYNQPIPPGDTTPWKTKSYTVHFRDPRKVLQNQLANPDFKLEMDFAPKRVFGEDNSRQYEDFMSGNWAWRQAHSAQDISVNTHGSTFFPIILGSDKTTVSVATGQNEYYPLYMSNGLVYNNVRRAHCNALFLKVSDRENQDSAEFRTFRRNLFHGSLRHILESLRPAMTVPEVTLFADGHYRRAIYGLGPYIADYPEQVLLACTVQGWCARCTASNKDLDGPSGRRSQPHTKALFDVFDHKTLWDDYGVIPDVLVLFTWTFPWADIHELLSPDLLHQVIKGTFKDHLVTWAGEYLEQVHGTAAAKKIMADIDRRIAAVPPFPGLRRFPEGRGFKQWTGEDSKALMKVYLPAIEGHATLLDIDAALARYHSERKIFEESGVCPNGFCLPRQHSLTHYRYLIQEFGAPNGLCSSITESKHIKAVKEPWRRSSRYEALGQMLTINDRLDKLAAARVDFIERGMLLGPMARALAAAVPAAPAEPPPPGPEEDEDDDLGGSDERTSREVKLARSPVRGPPSLPRNLDSLAYHLRLPTFPTSYTIFVRPDHEDLDIPLADYQGLPIAVATFYAPSDQSGLGGLLHERIRAVRSWRGGAPRFDCVFVEHDTTKPGFRGLLVARVLLFMSVKHEGIEYPCALVTWFSAIGDGPCPDVGMWMVEPDLDDHDDRIMDIIHIDSILRAAHLLPIFGDDFLPRHFRYYSSLDSFIAFYVNKYADHHSHEIAF